MQKLPIGKSDFQTLRQNNLYYVDKSELIAEIINENNDIILITRPRRFGKTLNLSMLECFFDINGKGKGLFEGLEISEMNEFAEHGKYPVISLSLKDIICSDYEEFILTMSECIRTLYSKYEDVLMESDILKDHERSRISELVKGSKNKILLQCALENLLQYLNRIYKQKPVLLIDEYDTPIHYGWLKGYYEKVIDFMRSFLSRALKDNPILYKAVLTGCLRISKESIFTGLNNLTVAGVLSKKFADKFGFTMQECEKLLEDYDLSDRYEEVIDWYNGYKFGGQEILNPWSVLKYIDEGEVGAYWANTSGNDLVKRLIKEGRRGVKEKIAGLLEGEKIEGRISENISFGDLKTREEAVYSLLLFSGYLKCEKKWREKGKYRKCRLGIPNTEVELIYEEIISQWLEHGYGNDDLKQMCRALIEGEIETFEEILQDFVVTTLSYFDPDREEPEALYLGFIAGLLLTLAPEYVVRTNRESGFGRYDVMIKPVDRKKRAIVMELKSVERTRHKDPEKAIEEAFKQIEDKGYVKELEAEGYEDVMRMVIVTDKKDVWVRVGATGRSPLQG